MRATVAVLEAQRDGLREKFGKFVEKQSRTVVARSDEVREAFQRNAKGFLFEDCRLVWSPQKAAVGQSGEGISFPAFVVEMAGTDFTSPVRRSGPEQVSESQREFIDLAFRMALMEVACAGGIGTLVIDAPEASLDAVFSARAADVLRRFAKPSKGNRLVVTSNLVEGTLLPALLGSSKGKRFKSARLVNLLNVAEPTAAVREMKAEYDRALGEILTGAISSD